MTEQPWRRELLEALAWLILAIVFLAWAIVQ